MYQIRIEIKFNNAVMGYFKGRGFAQGLRLLEYLKPRIEDQMERMRVIAAELLRGSYQGWEKDKLRDKILSERPKIELTREGRSYSIWGRIFNAKSLDDWCKERTASMGKTPYPYWRVIEHGAKPHLIESTKLMPIHLRSLGDMYTKPTKSDIATFDRHKYILRFGPFLHPGYQGVGFIRKSRYELRRALKRLVPELVGMQLREALGSTRMTQVM